MAVSALHPQPRRFNRLGGTCRLSLPGGELPRLPEQWRQVPEVDLQWGTPTALPPDLPAELVVEAYALEVSERGVCLLGRTPEAHRRACATLRQLLAPDGSLPGCSILDWPDFRYRCASDWLLNCEINRWAYDWGDGPEAYLARLKRKLDFCYDHKINQVWFDGFGWATERAAGTDYAPLMRECNRYARERGIKLTFAGYGGGYGTSYQKSELYRCGYQGRVFENRRPWPDGERYDCIGCDVPESRPLGTCATNAALQAAKVADLAHFVAAVEPGFMYVHDIDTGGFAASHHGWLWRCEQCRERWPSDEMTDPEGQAGAYAAWFRQVAEGLHAVRTDTYDAARDLDVIFVSPVYTTHDETGQPEVWEQEVAYFRLLSTLIGPHEGLHFGLREQFYRPDGSRRIAQLRQALDEVGHGHGLHVIAFAGGDNYTSDDLCNVSGALAGLYQGAHSVCLSNGGLHEEPVQVLNAGWLWNAEGEPVSLDPGSNEALDPVLRALRLGQYRPDRVFGATGRLREVCRHLWGEAVGDLLYQAYQCGGDSGRGPVSHVWWTVTREIRRLTAEYMPWNDRVELGELVERWAQRAETTRAALALARQAVTLTEDEDVRWFATSLEVGLGFAEVLAATYRWRLSGADAPRQEAAQRLERLGERMGQFALTPTDVLGGDPGCWRETVELLATVLAPTS